MNGTSRNDGSRIPTCHCSSTDPARDCAERSFVGALDAEVITPNFPAKINDIFPKSTELRNRLISKKMSGVATLQGSSPLFAHFFREDTATAAESASA